MATNNYHFSPSWNKSNTWRKMDREQRIEVYNTHPIVMLERLNWLDTKMKEKGWTWKSNTDVDSFVDSRYEPSIILTLSKVYIDSTKKERTFMSQIEWLSGAFAVDVVFDSYKYRVKDFRPLRFKKVPNMLIKFEEQFSEFCEAWENELAIDSRNNNMHEEFKSKITTFNMDVRMSSHARPQFYIEKTGHKTFATAKFSHFDNDTNEPRFELQLHPFFTMDEINDIVSKYFELPTN